MTWRMKFLKDKYYLSKAVKVISFYRSRVQRRFQYAVLTLKTLFYNEFLVDTYFLEILLEPLYWFIEKFSRTLGPIFVCCVIFFTGSVITIVYTIGLPYYWANYPNLTVLLMFVGHWLLINVVFHFFMGVTTDPGSPPKDTLISETVTVCKKCISPKPPRTHHCSVCNRCILRMDHHCPWLNNCVGHYNHRYFYMFMVYMVLGSLFIMLFGFEIAYKEVWLGGDIGSGWRDALYYYMGWEDPSEEDDLGYEDGYPVKIINSSHMVPVIDGVTGFPIPIEESSTDDSFRPNYWYRFCVMYTGMLTTGTFISLLGLSLWHLRLIGRGETSIEAHINKKETIRLSKLDQVYKNPYDYGIRVNFLVFFGLSNDRGLRHILLPSSHPPLGSGLTWRDPTHLEDDHEKAA